MRKMSRVIGLLMALAFLTVPVVSADETAELIKLPKPQTDGGKPLMQVLSARRTMRSFSRKELPQQMLSNLLWAAFGVNRPKSGKRTAPSARNWQEIDIYVATASGLYLFDARAHVLKRIMAEDIRAVTGTQRFTQVAPVNLIYVADYAKMGRAKLQDKVFYSATDTGFISQNVYLFAASEGLATVVLGTVKRQELAKKMNLRPDQKVTLTQPVGYPAR